MVHIEHQVQAKEWGNVELKSIADEEGRQAAINYGIMAVPAIAINNEIQFIGAPSLEELLEKLE